MMRVVGGTVDHTGDMKRVVWGTDHHTGEMMRVGGARGQHWCDYACIRCTVDHTGEMMRVVGGTVDHTGAILPPLYASSHPLYASSHRCIGGHPTGLRGVHHAGHTRRGGWAWYPGDLAHR
jgi:hypothetical protein